jgi:ATP-dependent Zn protease
VNKANNVSTYSTAIHEAGHAVMAYNLGVRFTEISVIPDEEQGSLGEISHARLPGWLQPDCLFR